MRSTTMLVFQALFYIMCAVASSTVHGSSLDSCLLLIQGSAQLSTNLTSSLTSRSGESTWPWRQNTDHTQATTSARGAEWGLTAHHRATLGGYNSHHGYMDIRAAGEFAKDITRRFFGRKVLTSALGADGERVPSFNPSMIAVPQWLSNQLGTTSAKYMAAIRHKGDQCDRLALGSTKNVQKRAGQTIAFFDSSFTLVESALVSEAVSSGRLVQYGGFDMRIFDAGHGILATFRKGPEWMVKQIQMTRNGDGKLEAWIGKRPGFPNVQAIADISYQYEKNIGLMKHNGHLTLLWGLAGGLNVTEDQGTGYRRITPVAELPKSGGVHLHNSINPVWLPSQKAFLTMGHAHLDDNDQLPKPVPENLPKYGFNYVQLFVLFEPQPPYRVLKVSPTFCLPSDRMHCEVVQFVMGLVLERDELTISYGLNDCEGAVIKMKLSDALSFVQHGHGVPSTLLRVVEHGTRSS